MKTLFLLVITTGSFLYCCQKNPLAEKLILSEELTNELKDKITENRALLYYHSGDCSICYSTLTRISEEFSGITIISLTSSEYKVIVEFHLEQIGFKGISVYDSSGVFIKRNLNLVENNNFFLIDSQFNILASGLNVEEKVFKEIRNHLDSSNR